MKTRTPSKAHWLVLALLTGLSSCALANQPVGVYEIGWDDGDGDAQRGGWHTVPKLVQGASTIQFSNQSVASEVQTDAGGIQIFRTDIARVDGDLLAFTEVTNSARHYVVKGEARWENVAGYVSIGLGISNANYAGNVATARTADGKNKWSGTQDWQPFTLVCDLPPAMRPPGSADPNRFIAEMGLKGSGGGILYLRNLRLEVDGMEPPAAGGSPYFNSAGGQPAPTTASAVPDNQANRHENFSFATFGAGLGLGILSCLVFVRLLAAHRKTNHERELRRIASLDSRQGLR